MASEKSEMDQLSSSSGDMDTKVNDDKQTAEAASPTIASNGSAQEEAVSSPGVIEQLASEGACASVPDAASSETTDPPQDIETIDFKLIFNKNKENVTFPLDSKVSELKLHMEKLTGVPAAMQKVMYKGRMDDEKTLREHNVVRNAKIMLIGSTVNDVLSVATPDPKVLKEQQKKEAATSKESFCKQKQHKTVLEKYGKPDDVLPGIAGAKEHLPHQPLSGMINKAGGKVRLTFKLEADQVWIGTKERTEKVPMGSIKAVVSEPIEGNEQYHIMGIQTGPTEQSRYWVYWVPAQYVDAIKDSILGKWQLF